MGEHGSSLIHCGAEAELYLTVWRGRKAVEKRRVPKPYRPPQLDFIVRTQRFTREATFVAASKEAGVPVPTLFWADKKNTTFCLEFIDGKLLRIALEFLTRRVLENVWTSLGGSVAGLHSAGIVHGDLTTSNMILTSESRVFLIDLGMAYNSCRAEDRAVDLHLLQRALQSTHSIASFCLNLFWKAYARALGREAELVHRRLQEVRRRGRYFASR